MLKFWRIAKDELAENQVANILIRDKSSARPATIFVRSFNFTRVATVKEVCLYLSDLPVI